MKADLLISNIGQLVTCASNGKPKRGAAMRDVGLVEDAAVAVIDAKIAAVGRTGEIRGDFESDNEIDAGRKVVCPGFVDPHTHIVFAGDRLDEFELKIKGADYLEILAAGGGILSTVEKTRSASVDDLVGSALNRLNKMLACGTTTAEIKTGYGLDIETEMKMMRVLTEISAFFFDIVWTFLPAHAVPPEYKDNADGYVDLICNEMLASAWRYYKRNSHMYKYPFFLDMYCERNAFTLEHLKRIFDAGKSLGFSLKAHVDQFTNLGGSKLAIEYGATSIDHLDKISNEEIALLARSETIGVVIPTENFSAGKTQFADARKLIDEGCAVALSTDYNPGSAPCPSQPMAMAIACRYQKLLPAEALNAATINAAFAIGLGDRVGSIEIGKSADLVLLDMYDYREAAYEFGGSLIKSVVKNGRVLIG